MGVRVEKRHWMAGGLVVVAAVAGAAVLMSGSDGNTKTYEVPSEAMEPTYSVEDKVTVNLDAYEDEGPAPGDVVVFHPPAGADTGELCGVELRAGEACAEPTAQPSRQIFLK